MLRNAVVLLLGAVCMAAEPWRQKPLRQPGHKAGKETGPGQKRALKGSFLHITDFHPDPHYKTFASTEGGDDCHRGSGTAGVYGAAMTDCDSPFTLINATFDWLRDHVRDEVDFVIWTGDSARHDSDEKIRRREAEVLQLNEMLVSKFTEVFGADGRDDNGPNNKLAVPVIPTFGNNDIMPHNIFRPGPNYWTKQFSKIWQDFIPESQRHSFERGGWFFVEVIPNELAVFSLNTIYLFDSNSAVDGCAAKSEPGYEHMEWLRIQLQFLRERGMKAIMMGHVPPARTDSKSSWDETCWQKYALWMQSYRDVVVGSVYGHMNIEHFMLQDFTDIKKKTKHGRMQVKKRSKSQVLGQSTNGEISIQSSAQYLESLRDDWAKIPRDPDAQRSEDIDDPSAWREDVDGTISDSMRRKKNNQKKKKGRKEMDKQRYLHKIGGEWAERYSVSLVSASIVPNYFPTFRIIHYNITGLETASNITDSVSVSEVLPHRLDSSRSLDDFATNSQDDDNEGRVGEQKKKKKKKHRPKKGKKKRPSFTLPKPPEQAAPPGPAYSPQSLTWLGYTVYYANLTAINNDVALASSAEPLSLSDPASDRRPKYPPHPKPFHFEVEYDTRHDDKYKMPDLTVWSWLHLARKIGQVKPPAQDTDATSDFNDTDTGDYYPDIANDISDIRGRRKKGKKRKKHRKHKHRGENERLWYAFLKRAFVSSKDEDELKEQFG